MLVRLYWNQCTLTRPENQPIDAFWVEATENEAKNLVFPYCSADIVARSQMYGARDREIAAQFGSISRPCCFLIAHDLSTIKPLAVHYPYSPMWNAYSPFRKIAEHHIDSLEKLVNFIPTEHPTASRASILVQ